MGAGFTLINDKTLIDFCKSYDVDLTGILSIEGDERGVYEYLQPNAEQTFFSPETQDYGTKLLCKALLVARESDPNPVNEAQTLHWLARAAKYSTKLDAGEARLTASVFFEKAIAKDPSNPRFYILYALLQAENGHPAEAQKQINAVEGNQTIDWNAMRKVEYLIIKARVYYAQGEKFGQQAVDSLLQALDEPGLSERDTAEAARLLAYMSTVDMKLLDSAVAKFLGKNPVANPASLNMIYTLSRTLLDLADRATIEDAAHLYRTARLIAKQGNSQTSQMRFTMLYAKATRELAGTAGGHEDLEQPDMLFNEARQALEAMILKMQGRVIENNPDGTRRITIAPQDAVEYAAALSELAEHYVDHGGAAGKQKAQAFFEEAEMILSQLLIENPNNDRARLSWSWRLYYEAKSDASVFEASIQRAAQTKDYLLRPSTDAYVSAEDKGEAIRVWLWSVLENCYQHINQARKIMQQADIETDPEKKAGLLKKGQELYMSVRQQLGQPELPQTIQLLNNLRKGTSARAQRDALYAEARYHYLVGRANNQDRSDRAIHYNEKLHPDVPKTARDFFDNLSPADDMTLINPTSLFGLPSMNTEYINDFERLRLITARDAFVKSKELIDTIGSLENRPGYLDHQRGYREYQLGNYLEAILLFHRALVSMPEVWQEYREDSYDWLIKSLRCAASEQKDGLSGFLKGNPQFKADLQKILQAGAAPKKEMQFEVIDVSQLPARMPQGTPSRYKPKSSQELLKGIINPFE